MSWLDLFILVAFGFLMFIAHQRGFILELTEWLAILVASAISFRVFRGIGNSLHSGIFSGFNLKFLEKSALLFFFVAVFLIIFSLGLTLQRRLKEDKVVDKLVEERLGVLVGFFKSIWLLTIGVGLIFYLELLPPREASKVRNGPIVSLFISTQTAVSPTIYLMAPSDLAEGYLKAGSGQ